MVLISLTSPIFIFIYCLVIFLIIGVIAVLIIIREYKNTKKAMEVLNNLLYEKEPIQKILITLYNHFKKLYIVKERVDVGYDYETKYYYLISDKNFEGYHEMGKRELSVKEIKNYDIMGRKVFISENVYDRKLNAILAHSEQVKY